MIRLLPQQLDSATAIRGELFRAEFIARAKWLDTHYEIWRNEFEELVQRYPVKGMPTTIKPVGSPPEKKPFVVWPNNAFGLMARTIKLMRTPEDIGVGDTIARVIGPIGGDAYKQWFLDTFGKACGCTERQENLNERFPYEKTD